jgi:hypothetical protein
MLNFERVPDIAAPVGVQGDTVSNGERRSAGGTFRLPQIWASP